MLVRAARRTVRSATTRSRSSYEQLQLPWLCPAYNPIKARSRCATFNTGSGRPEIRRRRNSTDVSIAPTRRAMATAVDYSPIDDIPFEGMGAMPQLSPPSRISSFTDGELYPLQSSLVFGNSPTPQLRAGSLGIAGDLEEIQSVFDACIHIGRVERAGTILKRISKIQGLNPNTLLELHNQLLRASVEQMIINHSDSGSLDLHKWFELEIRHKGVPQDIETVAYMVKASLQAPEGRRERLVNRYMDMLDENAALELLETEILTAREINYINHIYPKYNFATDLTRDSEVLEEDVYEPQEQDGKGTQRATPAVRPTEQKGLGLKTLKRSLSLFRVSSSQGIDVANATSQSKRDFQRRLEEDAVEAAVDRWREESAHLTKMGLNTSLQTKSLGARMWKWQKDLEQELKDELSRVDASEASEAKNRQDRERCVYGPFLRILPPEKLAAVTILAFMSKLCAMGAKKGLSLSTAIMGIAGSVEDECVYDVIQKQGKRGVWPLSKKEADQRLSKLSYMKNLSRLRGPGTAAKFASQHLIGQGPAGTPLQRAWPLAVKAKVGAYLMSALIEVSTVPATAKHPQTQEPLTQIQPAFSHSFQYKMGKKIGIVIAHKVLVAQLMREPIHSLLAKHLPMLVEPEPWTQFNKGGFLAHPSKMMRIKGGDKDQRFYVEAAIGQGNMKQTFQGLDVLGKTSWRINQAVFNVMLEAWNSGEAIANICPENPKLTIPAEPAGSTDPLERRRWINAVKSVENTRNGYHSQRCFQNFQLEIARALRNDEFFFPHNIDFRGRAYPIPPYLNHMGADHCRGLLRFGKGKALGEDGLRWLKIHLANVFGFDKASLSERESFAVDNMDNISDSATNPLEGKKWWLKAEDPWQCLAACMELRNAIESPDPTKFISHLPIHQDGTCNGLQHYAALGGDSWGAKQVNLEPGDRPADVYSAVANLVKESIAEDKKQGNPFAIVLDGKVTRKVVKQTVMTNVYGVTFIGAKEQVRKQLTAAYPDLPNDDSINPGNLSSYIATKTFTALSNMFRGAHDIQFWLGECASRISASLTAEQITRLETEWQRLKSKINTTPLPSTRQYVPPALDDLTKFKTSVIWTTPLNMPVVQPYRTSKARSVHTNMQEISLCDPHRSDPISKRKQLQGFPPNFIHSLDATHMLLSALRCDELGLSFAAVHDSFWTHASDISTMNNVLRDAFIRIHKEDVIGRLSAEFEARYRNSFYLAKIRSNSALDKKICKWRKEREALRQKGPRTPGLHKGTKLDELILERQRMRLLASSNPDEVCEGRRLVTPGSMFEEMSAEADIEPEDDLQTMGLGDISSRESLLSSDSEVEGSDSAIIEQTDDHSHGSTQLDASLGSDAEMGGEEDFEPKAAKEDRNNAESIESESNASPFEKRLRSRGPRKARDSTHIWLPLTLPPVPKRGEFDVSRLKDSKYFFS